MSFDFPVLNSLHFEYDLLFCVFNNAVFIPHRAFTSWVLFGSLTCVIVLTVFLVEISVSNIRTGINHCLYRAMSFL